MTKLNKLNDFLNKSGPFAVACSGGVDSMTLAVVAHRANPGTEIFHAVSAAVPDQATDRVKQYAAQEGWNLKIVEAGEIDDPDYVANPANRCYYCKTHLYDTLVGHSELTVASGTNMDDLGDYRPGLVAAKEHDVVHPYVEAEISKQELRDIARELNLTDLHDLPAAPCLSSRVTTGIAIDAELLPVINETEQALWEALQLHLPLKGVRCRIKHEAVSVQVETPASLDPGGDYNDEAKSIVERIFTEHGFEEYLKAVSVEPYERGSAFLIDTLQVK
jgi:pyridinium-3,5-biscarboxylic acid mononucleotide sulfurtransferase